MPTAVAVPHRFADSARRPIGGATVPPATNRVRCCSCSPDCPDCRSCCSTLQGRETGREIKKEKERKGKSERRRLISCLDLRVGCIRCLERKSVEKRAKSE